MITGFFMNSHPPFACLRRGVTGSFNRLLNTAACFLFYENELGVKK
jgi:hypothetical protein